MDTGSKAEGWPTALHRVKAKAESSCPGIQFLGPGMKTELLRKRKSLTLKRASMNT